jgi:uncharacterized damage-inducible protein DinB
MRTKLAVIALLFSFFGFAQNEVIAAFSEKWANSKVYLIEIAKVMPEDFYDFKPTEREMSFKEQLLHIKENMDWLSTSYFTNMKFTKNKTTPYYSKDQVISMLEVAFDNANEKIKNTDPNLLLQKVAFFAGEKTKLQILNLLQDHVTHHRGQLIVYLNLKEITPPKYIGW